MISCKSNTRRTSSGAATFRCWRLEDVGIPMSPHHHDDVLRPCRAQRDASAADAKAKKAAAAAAPEAVVLYASQTGTAQEIARNIQARNRSLQPAQSLLGPAKLVHTCLSSAAKPAGGYAAAHMQAQ